MLRSWLNNGLAISVCDSAGHWKIKQVWVNYFGRWLRDTRAVPQAKKQGTSPGSGNLRTTIPDVKDVKGPVSNTDVNTFITNAPTSGTNDRWDATSKNNNAHTSSKRGCDTGDKIQFPW